MEEIVNETIQNDYYVRVSDIDSKYLLLIGNLSFVRKIILKYFSNEEKKENLNKVESSRIH